MRAALANSLWLASAAPAAARFACALRHPKRVQERLLRHYLASNADTAFGRKHRFERLRDVDDFRRAVPLSRYEDYAPYIDAIAAGEQRVLTSEPVRCFVPSSGSTGSEKLIPYTAELRREFSRAISPWIFDLYRHHPALLRGKSYWSISPAIGAPRSASRIPVGFDEDSAYVGNWAKRLVDATLAVPGTVKNITDIDDFRYLSLLFLLRCRNLSLVSLWHPSFLLLLLEQLPALWSMLLRDIRLGVSSIRNDVAARYLRPDAPRSDQLRSMDPRDYARIWPRLRLISCWADAHAATATALPALQSAFPGVTIQGKGLIATEGFISLPYGEQKPVAICSHFFEFIADDGTPLLTHELETGRTYSVVITTGGGLYRYRLSDRVRVTGCSGRTPCLEFLGKEDHVSDLCGEKLDAEFVARALGNVLMRCNVRPRFSMLAPDGDHYVLYIESDDGIPAELANVLDEELRTAFHYGYCRTLGQLAAARVFCVRGDAQGQFLAAAHRRGHRVGSVKPCCLSREASPLDFKGAYLSTATTQE